MTIELKVPDMACDACAKTITEVVQNLDAQATVTADTQTKQVIIETDLAASLIKEAIATAGYSPN